MKNFETKLDDHPLNINLLINTDALLDGKNAVYITIYHPDQPRRWRKIKVKPTSNTEFKASIKKERLVTRPVVKIRTSFIVDDLNQKEQIAKTTDLEYKFSASTNTDEDKVYMSKYKDDFNMGSPNDQTFNVIKKIEVIFNN